MIYIGIDPGKNGGMALLDDDRITNAGCEIPLAMDDFHAYRFYQIIRDWTTGCSKVIFVLEKVHSMPKQGVVSTFTFGRIYGEIRGILRSLNLPLLEPAPQVWKKLVLHGMDWKGNKAASIYFAGEKYPEIDLKPGRKRTPHDGIADAVCLAEYGRLVQEAKR